ncbi:MAG: PIN domain-containing protein [Deltaproteobacteria bacterium]|jgi:PIN domain nuclease of toxin-antitoxin system|nr:PIN domain-containing protein [Deltaproteobacteria bacterium]
MTNVYFLDACALLATFKEEIGYITVADLYAKAEKGELSLRINIVNLLEVFYGLVYDFGLEFSEKRLSEVTNSSVEITNLSLPTLKEAARFKTTYKISLADSIVLAETSVSNGTIITSDHHEMDIVEQNESHIKFLWIR